MGTSRASAYNGIFQNLSGEQRPALHKSDIAEYEKVAAFVRWFLVHEPFVQAVASPEGEDLFRRVYRPGAAPRRHPVAGRPISSLPEWFTTKVFIDLNMLKEAPQESFGRFIDLLDTAVRETFSAGDEVALRYGLDLEGPRGGELDRIPLPSDREWLSVNLFCDIVLSAEIRIMAWLYRLYYSQRYEPRHRTTGA